MAHLVLNTVDLAILYIKCANEHVIGDVVQVATVLEPGPGHTDVVSCALALHLDENARSLHTNDVLSTYLFRFTLLMRHHMSGHQYLLMGNRQVQEA